MKKNFVFLSFSSLTSVLVSEAEPGPDGHLRSHDPLATVEVVLALVHVHSKGRRIEVS